ncbi:MAG: XTP/dITP diphosphatase [Nitrospirae bacterium]|nr:XTP/dITP diphosphatase [Nitrospirota bacterium]
MELVIASKNVHKIREFRSMLKPLSQLDVYSLLDFPSYTPLPETGTTFEENASAKATHAAKTLDKIVIADDSGIVILALDGKPGINSARYAGENATDKENREKLLKEMAHLKDSERAAYYECCIAVATPEGQTKVVRGLCEGEILLTERGNLGFGYDSLFIKYDYSKTFAEMNEETKNRISHRRKAIEKVLPYLESLCNTVHS